MPNERCFRRTLFRQLLVAILWLLALPAAVFPRPRQDMLMRWNALVLPAVSHTKSTAPTGPRALAIVHTCMYDAWAAYDEKAVGTQLGGALRRPARERTQANKEKAIAYAAYRGLTDLFPSEAEKVYKPLMRELGYDPEDKSTDIETPQGIGNVACAAVLEYRHRDGANQLGDEADEGKEGRVEGGATTTNLKNEEQSTNLKIGHYMGAPYEDWTGYRPVNAPGTVPARATFTKPMNPDRWQPLTYTDANGNFVVQMFSTAHWWRVKPFAWPELGVAGPANEAKRAISEDGPYNGAKQSRQDAGGTTANLAEPGPAKYGTAEFVKETEELVALSGNLTDKQKMLAEYWTDGPGKESVAEHWMRFAEFVCERDHASLDDEVKLFFVLSNAMMDADIAAWDAKRFYDSGRPATTVPLLFRGKRFVRGAARAKARRKWMEGSGCRISLRHCRRRRRRSMLRKRAQRVRRQRGCWRYGRGRSGSDLKRHWPKGVRGLSWA